MSAVIEQSKLNPDVIILSETWFPPGCCFNDSYVGHHSFRDDRGGDGVSVYVRATLDPMKITQCSFVTDIIEACTVEVTVSPSAKLIVVGVYRPPDKSFAKAFMNQLNDQILTSFPPSN